MNEPLTEQEMERREGLWIDEVQRRRYLREAHAALRAERVRAADLDGRSKCSECGDWSRAAYPSTPNPESDPICYACGPQAADVKRLRVRTEADRRLLGRCRQLLRATAISGAVLADLDARLGKGGEDA